MTSTPSEDFADWLGQHLPPDPAPAAPGTEEPATPSAPRPDPSQGGKDTPLTTSPHDTFARLIHDTL